MKSLVLFLALFRELMADKHHVCHASVRSDATLALLKVFFGDGWYESIELDTGEYFTSDGELGHSLEFGAIAFSTLAPVQGHDNSVMKTL